MKLIDKFMFCKIQTVMVEVEPDRYEYIGVDFRSFRLCPVCGEERRQKKLRQRNKNRKTKKYATTKTATESTATEAR